MHPNYDKNLRYKLIAHRNCDVYCGGMQFISEMAETGSRLHRTLGWGPVIRWELMKDTTDFILSTFAPHAANPHGFRLGRGSRCPITMIRTPDGTERHFPDAIVRKARTVQNGTVIEIVIPPAPGYARMRDRVTEYLTRDKQSDDPWKVWKDEANKVFGDAIVQAGLVNRDFDSEINRDPMLKAHLAYKRSRSMVPPRRMTPALEAAINEGTISLTNAYALAKLPLEYQDDLIMEATIESPSVFGPKMERLRKELRDRPKRTQARLVAGRIIEDGDYAVTIR